jgi:hypothetical protein
MEVQDIPVNIGIWKWARRIYAKDAGEMANAREVSHD